MWFSNFSEPFPIHGNVRYARHFSGAKCFSNDILGSFSLMQELRTLVKEIHAVMSDCPFTIIQTVSHELQLFQQNHLLDGLDITSSPHICIHSKDYGFLTFDKSPHQTLRPFSPSVSSRIHIFITVT